MEDTYELLTERREGGRERGGEREEGRERGREKKKEIKRNKRNIIFYMINYKRKEEI